MRKILYYCIGLLIVAFFIELQPIKALQKEYINSQNVVMDYDLYLKLCDIYSEEYMEVITQERYEILKNSDFSNIEIKEYKSFSDIQPCTTSFETSYKVIKIIKNGEWITLNLTWKKMPSTRSYDVIGIRLVGTEINGGIIFQQMYKQNGTKVDSNKKIKNFDNGFGISFKLPTGDIDSLNEVVEFKYTGTGKIFGTYQHAQQSISLTDSQKYTLSASGLGNVLLFDNKVSSKYDAMSGVYIKV